MRFILLLAILSVFSAKSQVSEKLTKYEFYMYSMYNFWQPQHNTELYEYDTLGRLIKMNSVSERDSVFDKRINEYIYNLNGLLDSTKLYFFDFTTGNYNLRFFTKYYYNANLLCDSVLTWDLSLTGSNPTGRVINNYDSNNFISEITNYSPIDSTRTNWFADGQLSYLNRTDGKPLQHIQKNGIYDNGNQVWQSLTKLDYVYNTLGLVDTTTAFDWVYDENMNFYWQKNATVINSFNGDDSLITVSDYRDSYTNNPPSPLPYTIKNLYYDANNFKIKEDFSVWQTYLNGYEDSGYTEFIRQTNGRLDTTKTYSPDSSNNYVMMYKCIYTYETDSLTNPNNGNVDFVLYPNPADNNVNLEFQNSTNRIIQLFNQYGVLVKYIFSTDSIVAIDISNLPSGIYIVNINDGVVASSTTLYKQ